VSRSGLAVFLGPKAKEIQVRTAAFQIALVLSLLALGPLHAEATESATEPASAACFAIEDLAVVAGSAESKAIDFACTYLEFCRCRCLNNLNLCVAQGGGVSACYQTFYACDDACIARYPNASCPPFSCG